MGYRVSRDGRTLARCESANDAFVWLLRHQGQSVHYATTYGGYSIEEEAGYTLTDKGRQAIGA